MIRMKDEAEQGFTLVEMLAVLSIIGLMSGLMLVMMGQFRGLISIDRSISEQAALQKTANHIAQLLEQAEALPLAIGKEGVAPSIESTGTSIRFSAVSRHRDSKSGLGEHFIAIEEKAGIAKLVETRTPRRLSARDGEAFRIVLLDNVKSLSFSFLEIDPLSAAKRTWRADWQNVQRLPTAIRLVIAKENRSGKLIEAAAIAYVAR